MVNSNNISSGIIASSVGMNREILTFQMLSELVCQVYYAQYGSDSNNYYDSNYLFDYINYYDNNNTNQINKENVHCIPRGEQHCDDIIIQVENDVFWRESNENNNLNDNDNNIEDNLNKKLRLECEFSIRKLYASQRNNFHDYGNNHYDACDDTKLEWIMKK